MLNNVTIEQLGILITLVLTVLGWFVTAWYQRKILDHQLASERRKDAKQLIIPVRIQKLNEIRSWVDRSIELMTLKLGNLLSVLSSEEFPEPQINDLGENFRNWYAKSGKYAAFLTQMRTYYKPKDEEFGNLIGQLHREMFDFMSPRLIKAKEIETKIRSISDVTAKLYLEIDELIELCAVDELRYKK